MSTFFMISGNIVTKKWKRFKSIELGDYFYMSDSYYDAIMLKPQMDIYLLGFAVMNHYAKIPFKITFKIVIDTDESPEYQVDFE